MKNTTTTGNEMTTEPTIAELAACDARIAAEEALELTADSDNETLVIAGEKVHGLFEAAEAAASKSHFETDPDKSWKHAANARAYANQAAACLDIIKSRLNK